MELKDLLSPTDYENKQEMKIVNKVINILISNRLQRNEHKMNDEGGGRSDDIINHNLMKEKCLVLLGII